MDYLIDLVGRMGQWGYALLFLAAMLESAALLGLLVPGEALLLAAGFFASQGAFDLDAVVAVIALGAIAGDSAGYAIGSRWGRDLLIHYGARIGATRQRVESVDAFVARYGNWSVFLGRFVGFARALLPLLAGSLAMPYPRFLAFNAAGAAIWSVVVVLLGYYVGESWRAAEAWIGNITTVLLALVGLGLAFHLRRFIRSVVPLDLALIVISVGIFGAIAEDVLTQDPLVRLDASLWSWLAKHHTETLTTLLTSVTRLHDPLPVTILMVGVGGLLLWKRRYRWWVTFVAATAGGTLLNLALKQVFHRSRPLIESGVLAFGGFSFPSGHVAAATLLWGFVAAFGVAHIRNTRWRITVVASAVVMVLVVAFSRLYLGAHFLSDTLAAIVAAVAWLTLCVVIFHGRLSYGRDGQHSTRPRSNGASDP